MAERIPTQGGAIDVEKLANDLPEEQRENIFAGMFKSLVERKKKEEIKAILSMESPSKEDN